MGIQARKYNRSIRRKFTTICSICPIAMAPIILPSPECAVQIDMVPSLPNAKPAENAIEQIIRVNAADHLTKLLQRPAQLQRE